MAKKRKNSKKQKAKRAKKNPVLPTRTKSLIGGVLMFLTTIVVSLSFFDLAGRAGALFKKGAIFLVGKTIFFIPLILALVGIALFKTKYKRFLFLTVLAILILIIGISGIFQTLHFNKGEHITKQGGWIGFLVSWPLSKAFGVWASLVILIGIIVVGGIILMGLLDQQQIIPAFFKLNHLKKRLNSQKDSSVDVHNQNHLQTQFLKPVFKIEKIKPPFTKKPKPSRPQPSESLALKPSHVDISSLRDKDYKLPPLSLLNTNAGEPKNADIKVNSKIIKRTLQNFGIEVEMSEVNIGPTVTQYTLSPAEGIKLSRITTLSSDLSLALAAHPIRIEAPIPGRSLVGIEIPNKSRVMVRLGSLLKRPEFQECSAPLVFGLGEDVAGNPVFADLARMPHLLVAGSTGSGKTVCLNNIIVSLLYRNSPKTLKLILVDPKRVEFPSYTNLPHVLCPVIFKAQKTVAVLRWLTTEMERRFDVLAEHQVKNIAAYNEMVKAKKNRGQDSKLTQEQSEIMPYIVLVIDELADLMAAKGKEMETAVVRLAQMSRAVGIHLVIATQRPSVEVITGLIKANVTSRISFQVASQVDSRTVLDMAGAERLIGLGDMLFLSSASPKPKRVQGAFISSQEVKKVIQYLSKQQEPEPQEEQKSLAQSLNEELEQKEPVDLRLYQETEPLYQEAKEIVIAARKASASLLQRRLRIGYARAARILDILEDRGVIGPIDGAKPRKVFIDNEDKIAEEEQQNHRTGTC